MINDNMYIKYGRKVSNNSYIKRFVKSRHPSRRCLWSLVHVWLLNY